MGASTFLDPLRACPGTVMGLLYSHYLPIFTALYPGNIKFPISNAVRHPNPGYFLEAYNITFALFFH
jgi:hypothetical protein